MEQVGDNWLKWRNKGIGSSDAPVIMEVSPYMTRLQLWEEKLGIGAKRDGDNFITQFGKHFEKLARSHFELQMGFETPPECIEHKEFAHLRSSMDAINMKERVFAEIKYMGNDNFDECVAGKKTVDHHFPQVMHQFMCSGFERGFYVPYTLTSDRKQIDRIEVIPLAPDREYIEQKLFPAEQDFWNAVLTQTAPELGPKDIVTVKDAGMIELANRYSLLSKSVKEIEAQMDEAKKQLEVLLEKGSVIDVGGLRITRVLRQGNVNYKAIPQLAGVDLDQYRGKHSSYAKFTLPKATK